MSVPLSGMRTLPRQPAGTQNEPAHFLAGRMGRRDPTIQCLVSPIPFPLPQTLASVLPYSRISTNCILILGCPPSKNIPPLAWPPNFICLTSTFGCSTNRYTIQCQRPWARRVQGRRGAEKSNLYLAYNYPTLNVSEPVTI